MEFLDLFNLVNFDEKGNAKKETYSNFLYLVSKYNQILLQENRQVLPEFFKKELSGVLENCDDGAKEKVLANCLLRVRKAFVGKSDRAALQTLNSLISAKDEEFACLVGKKINHLQLAYVVTAIAGKVERKIESLLPQQTDQKQKSRLFKDVIKYNRLVLTAEKVGSGELQAKDLCPVVA